MRRAGIVDVWRGASQRATLPQSRVFGTPRSTLAQRLQGFLSIESVFRLILAFVLAIALWLYVNSRNAPDASVVYPQAIAVAPENIPSGLTIRNVIPSVTVSIRPSQLGVQIPPSAFVASIDLQGLGPGLHRSVPVHLSWDPTVSVVSYRPRSAAVVLEPVVSKDVPVQIRVLSAPAYGYALKPGSLYVTPSTVRISGPKPFVAQVAKAAVFVALGSDRTNIHSSFTPSLENAQGRAISGHVSVSPGIVHVHAVIQQLAAIKTLPILVSVRGEPAAGFGVTSIQVLPSGLTAYGPPRYLGALDSLDTRPVFVGGMRGGWKRIRVRLRVPRHVYVPRRRVTVTVHVGPVSGAASFTAAVRPVGNSTGYNVTLSPGSVLVTIDGPSPGLGSAATHVVATVNVVGLSPGTYKLPLTVSVPRGDRLDSVSVHSVQVTLHPHGG
ncbi:MAG TPA: hypothetical protein VFB34_04770 [Chloroflexota bacterium]|nr:hypothetical protein [Chloroflexota bacterium]